MEDVLDFYDWPPKEGTARLCFDKRPCQLLGEVITALPMEAGKSKREDNEYTSNGTAVILLAHDIDTGKPEKLLFNFPQTKLQTYKFLVHQLFFGVCQLFFSALFPFFQF
jgi:hypothetical protein